MNFNLQDIGINKDELKKLVVDAIIEQVTYTHSVDDEGNAHRQERLIDELKREIKEIIQKNTTEIIGKRLNECTDEILNGPFQPVDNWGDKKGEATTLRDMIKKRSGIYLEEKVDSDGKLSNYNGHPRLDWLISKIVKDQLDCTFKKEITQEVERAKLTLKNLVAKHISETLMKA